MSAVPESGNKAVIRRLMDAMNSGDVDLVLRTMDEVFDPGVRQHSPFEITGLEQIKETVVARLYQAFPDLHLRLDDLIEEGDMLVERDTVTGTHLGEFNGIPPTGKSVSYSEIFILRFVNGKIAEAWGVVDIFTQMKQLGLIPA
jgi:predicted ester cyclase